ncbi:amidohydrolase [Pseudomonas cichorii]|nr:amidohydrolase [Pseudomonas cichorii]
MAEHAKELVLFNAAIYTLDTLQPWADAMAVRDGRIVAVGSEQQARAAVSSAAQIIDLEGRMVMPGLADIHNHFLIAGRTELYEISFPPNTSLDDIIERVREAARDAPMDRWITGGIWGSNMLDQLTYEARLRLDEAAGGRPVMLTDDSHHNRWLNDAGLEACGIDNDTPDPPNGTVVRRPENGEATGLLLEAAVSLAEGPVGRALAAEPERDVAAGVHALKKLNSVGITALQEPLSARFVMDAIKSMAERDLLTSWVVGTMPVQSGPFSTDAWGEELFALRDEYRSQYFRPEFGKLFMDGVPTTHTSALLEPYVETETYGCCFRGTNFMTVPQLAKVIADCEKADISVKIHCTGDGSVRAALDAFEVVRTFNGGSRRHQIAHAGYVHPDDVPRFVELDIVADLSPMLWFPGIIVEQLKVVLSEERVDKSHRHVDMEKAGVLMAAGSDWPVVPDPNPFIGLQGIITRRDPTGQFPGAIGADQGLDLATALRVYTLDPVRAMGLEKETGSLVTGKSADFIVLDRNLFQIPAEQLIETRVLQTYFAGQRVYEAQA